MGQNSRLIDIKGHQWTQGKRKKKKIVAVLDINYDDEYDPLQPNSYTVYEESDEKLLKEIEWEKYKNHELSSSDSENEDEPPARVVDRRFAPPTFYNATDSEPEKNTLWKECKADSIKIQATEEGVKMSDSRGIGVVTIDNHKTSEMNLENKESFRSENSLATLPAAVAKSIEVERLARIQSSPSVSIANKRALERMLTEVEYGENRRLYTQNSPIQQELTPSISTLDNSRLTNLLPRRDSFSNPPDKPLKPAVEDGWGNFTRTSTPLESQTEQNVNDSRQRKSRWDERSSDPNKTGTNWYEPAKLDQYRPRSYRELEEDTSNLRNEPAEALSVFKDTETRKNTFGKTVNASKGKNTNSQSWSERPPVDNGWGGKSAIPRKQDSGWPPSQQSPGLDNSRNQNKKSDEDQQRHSSIFSDAANIREQFSYNQMSENTSRPAKTVAPILEDGSAIQTLVGESRSDEHEASSQSKLSAFNSTLFKTNVPMFGPDHPGDSIQEQKTSYANSAFGAISPFPASPEKTGCIQGVIARPAVIYEKPAVIYEKPAVMYEKPAVIYDNLAREKLEQEKSEEQEKPDIWGKRDIGKRMMSRLGWSEGQSLGSDPKRGILNPLVVQRAKGQKKNMGQIIDRNKKQETYGKLGKQSRVVILTNVMDLGESNELTPQQFGTDCSEKVNIMLKMNVYRS